MPTTYKSHLISKREVADRTMEFKLAKPAGLEYRAGQFFDIVVPDGGEGLKHGFSFVSAPFEDYIAAATRMRKDSTFKNALKQVPDGADLGVIAVWGDFVLPKNESIPVVYVTGGIGITPILSMLRQATHDKTAHKLTLLYANRTPADAAFTDELQALAKANPNFTFVPVYTRAQVAGVEHGHVDAAMVKRHVDDIAGSRYYVSGPEGMVHAMRQVLIEVGADEDNIRTEEFEGY